MVISPRSGGRSPASLGRIPVVAGLALLLTAMLPSGPALAQETGSIRGAVVLAETGEPMAGVRVILARLGLATTTDEAGQFVLDGIPTGQHEILAQRGTLQSGRVSVVVESHRMSTVDLVLAESYQLEQLTVTATRSGLGTDRDLFNAVRTMHAGALASRSAGTLAEVLNEEPGLAVRSFGPGSARPIIRGFDGDRVLIMQDGVRTGDLSSQSADHGTTIDPTSLRRLEVVKGPATLLYGTNAIGGVVNAITNHDYYRTPPPSGWRGGATLDGTSANSQAGINAWAQAGENGWLFWGSGGYRDADDYRSPEGTVPNTAARQANASGGMGYFGPRAFFSLGGTFEEGRYGVPFADEFEGGHEDHEHGDEEHEGEEIEIDTRRVSGRGAFGLVNLNGFVESVRGTVSFTDWHHEEIHGGEAETLFDNLTLVYRVEADQAQREWWGGTFGIWGQHRDYAVDGAEALSPPVIQNSFAGFVMEEFELGRARLQLGGRFEWNAYTPDAEDLRARSFSGISASIGMNVPVTPLSNFYVNLTESYRAPALEELYNNGPHVGSLTYEIGDPDLNRELALGLDAGFKHGSDSFDFDVSAFYYDILDYIYLDPTGEEEDGLPVGEFAAGDARYMGYEVSLDWLLAEELWFNVMSDYVRAELKADRAGIPRIPPLRARFGLDWHVLGVRVKPMVTFAASQDRVAENETPTDGYALLDLALSYSLERGSQQHQITLRFDNITDELYRNHSSYIKDLAPEMGRTVRLSYSATLF
jgi:iron complex outermembrane receptor protein